jgi:hypothetical protein
MKKGVVKRGGENMPMAFPIELVREEFPVRARKLIDELMSPGGAAVKLINAKDLVDRILKPSDVGLTTVNWTFTLSSTEEFIIDKELDDKTMVILFGVFNLDTNKIIKELEIGTGAGPVENVQLEFMEAFDTNALIFEKPIIYSPKSRIRIKAKATAAGTQRLGFIGVVIEPVGRTIYKMS